MEYYWVAHWFKKERDDLDLGKWSTTEYFEITTKGQKDKRSGGEYPRMKAFFTQFLGPKSTPLFVKCPKVNRNSTDKDHYMLEHALLELI